MKKSEMKYEFVVQPVFKNNKCVSLGIIKALKDFGDVKKGDIGGGIESFLNLSQFGDCWVYPDGKIYGDSIAADNAKIYGSIHGTVSAIGNAVVPKYVDISSDNKILIIKSNDNNETVIG